MAGGARSGTSRGFGRALALGLLLLVTAPAAPAGAADSRGAASQDGWWNRLQGPAENEPEGNPLRPLVPAVPKPPNVPADAIASSGGAGQVDKVAAVGIDLALADGASVEGLTLRLKESAAGGANIGAEEAKVLACPAVIPWGPIQNGAWRDRPTADCTKGSAEGVRAADGTWVFDLTALGRRWGDPFAPLPANGVVLSVDPAASTTPVQVSWLNVDSGQIAVELAATPGLPPPDGADDGTAPVPLAAAAPAPPSGPPYRESGVAPRSYTGGGGVTSDPPAFASGQPAFVPADAPAAHTAESAAPAQPEPTPPAPPAPAPVPRTRSSVDFWERVPTPTVLLVPLALGLAVLVGVVLGPGGRPSPVFVREGGLSRALARRQPGGAARLGSAAGAAHPPAAPR